MALTTQMTASGNLTRDPEIRYTQGGQAVASFSIATTPRSYNRDTKQYEDGEAIFTNCTLWGKPAEHFAASAQKGTRVIASGTLKSRTYTNRAGEQKTSTELVVDEVGLSTMFTSVAATNAKVRDTSPPAQQEQWSQPPLGDDTPF